MRHAIQAALVVAVTAAVSCAPSAHSPNPAPAVPEVPSTEVPRARGYDEVWDETHRGVRLVLEHHRESQLFKGTLTNETQASLREVRVKVRLDDVSTLGPTTPKVLGPGETTKIEIDATDYKFDTFTAQVGHAVKAGDGR